MNKHFKVIIALSALALASVAQSVDYDSQMIARMSAARDRAARNQTGPITAYDLQRTGYLSGRELIEYRKAMQDAADERALSRAAGPLDLTVISNERLSKLNNAAANTSLSLMENIDNLGKPLHVDSSEAAILKAHSSQSSGITNLLIRNSDLRLAASNLNLVNLDDRLNLVMPQAGQLDDQSLLKMAEIFRKHQEGKTLKENEKRFLRILLSKVEPSEASKIHNSMATLARVNQMNKDFLTIAMESVGNNREKMLALKNHLEGTKSKTLPTPEDFSSYIINKIRNIDYNEQSISKFVNKLTTYSRATQAAESTFDTFNNGTALHQKIAEYSKISANLKSGGPDSLEGKLNKLIKNRSAGRGKWLVGAMALAGAVGAQAADVTEESAPVKKSEYGGASVRTANITAQKWSASAK